MSLAAHHVQDRAAGAVVARQAGRLTQRRGPAPKFDRPRATLVHPPQPPSPHPPPPPIHPSWTIEALASKFRVRRQRILAILALKEVEAHAIEGGGLMRGPFRPFAFTVDMADVRTDALGEPLDLGDVVHAEPAAAAAVKQQQRRQQERGRQQQQQKGKGKGGGAAAADDLLGSLSDFVEPGAGGGRKEGGQRQRGGGGAAGGAAGEPLDALSQLLLASDGREHDLALVMPRLAATAQRVHLHLLRLLRRCSYSPDELRRQLLARLDAAEAVWAEQVAGTPLEAALIAAARELEAQQQQQQQQQGEEGQQAGAPDAPEQPAEGEEAPAAAEGGEEGAGGSGSSGSASSSMPRCLDFGWQRQQIDALVAALTPLMDRAGSEQERETARLGLQLQTHLQSLGSSGAQHPPEDASSSSSSSSSEEALRALVAAAQPVLLVAAFNQLDLDGRRRLLDAAPDARVILNVRGVDLKGALDAAAPAYSPARAAVSAIGANAAGASALRQLPEWPGAVPPLVDAFGFEDIPRKLLSRVVAALQPLEEAARDLDRLLATAAGEPAAATAAATAGPSSADVTALVDAAACYSTLIWAYDKVLDGQAAELAGGEEPPAPPPNAQRRMMRILRELDPRGGCALALAGKCYRFVGFSLVLSTPSTQPTSKRNQNQPKTIQPNPP